MFIFITLLLISYSGELIYFRFKLQEVNNRKSVLDEIFSDKADDIRALYPPQTDNRDNMVQIEQDAIFDCPTRRLLQSGTDKIQSDR